MTDQETRLAIEAIRLLKARYFRCVDAKDWNGFAAVLAPDVRFDISEDVPGTVLDSPQAVVELTSAGLKECVSVHHGHCPEIRITSDTTAEGIWAMEDILRWNPGAESSIQTLHGYGHYHETYRKSGGEWRIQTLRLVRLRIDTTGWDTTPAAA